MDRSLIARPQNQKRQPADETSRTSSINPPSKNTKTGSEIELDAWWSWEYPPEFYDRLSKIELTHRALKELGRRNRTERSPSPPASPITQVLSRTTSSRELTRFARHGGPDLRDLRGYPSTDAISTFPTPSTTMAKTKTNPKPKTPKSSPYSRNFELHLTENAILPESKSRKPDLAEVRSNLLRRRLSLSPSNFSDGAFEAFAEKRRQAKDEGEVMTNIIPTILGPSQANRFYAGHTVFTNLEPLTDGNITAPKPDIYYGAYPDQLARSTRNELASHIVPSTREDKPMAPNFFLEIKGPDGTEAVAMRQARYHGAIGSRGIHSLQNYGAEEPEYDGKAYTFSSTYNQGFLNLYAHHATAPATEGGRPEYHMTMVQSHSMINDRDSFVKGATALRNTIDFAEKQRDGFVRAANIRASQLGTASHQEHTIAAAKPPEDSPEEPTLSSTRYLDMGDDSQDPPTINPPTSFTSSIDPSQGLPKLRRSPRRHPVE